MPTILDNFTGLSNARFHYIRLRCINPQDTIDFYTSLGLSLTQHIHLPSKQLLLFSYMQTSDIDTISLLFEYDSLFQQHDESDPDNSSVHNLHSTHILFYVHFLPRIIKRISSKSYHSIKVPFTHHSEITAAVLSDPNGIEIRLIELKDSYAGVTGKQNWFTRIGYIVLDVDDGEEASQWYEKIFSARVVQSGKGLEGVDLTRFTENGVLGKGREEEPILQGFRLVDSEQVLNGLSHVLFYWMGNVPRNQGTCVCFVKALRRQPMSLTKSGLGAVIGIGFYVPLLSDAMEELRGIAGWKEAHAFCNGIGFVSRFDDPFGLGVDIVSDKDRRAIIKEKVTKVDSREWALSAGVRGVGRTQSAASLIEKNKRERKQQMWLSVANINVTTEE